MRLEVKKYLEDINRAANRIFRFTKSKTFQEYSDNDLLRSGVERQFEIIAEAINRMSKIEPDILSRISKYQRIISFRNILIHDYDMVDDHVVWDIIQIDLPKLNLEIQNIIKDSFLQK